MTSVKHSSETWTLREAEEDMINGFQRYSLWNKAWSMIEVTGIGYISLS